MVEGYAAERAALCRTARDLAAIHKHDEAFRRARVRQPPDANRAIAQNQALHFTVYRAAGLPELLPIIEGLWLRIGPVINFDLRGEGTGERMEKSDRCHARMVSAIARADGPGARTALGSDIAGAARNIESRGVLPGFDGMKAKAAHGSAN